MKDLDKIFKAYDIRGVYPEDINEEIAYRIGWAVAQFLKAKEIVVGRDVRNSSENLSKNLIEGIRDYGDKVIDIGLSTSPMFYFAVAKNGFKGGIMITASHNPAKYNGFKIVSRGAMPVGDNSGLDKIQKILEKDKFKNKKRGEIEQGKVLDDYIKHVLSFCNIKSIKNLKIIADTANGAAGLVVPKLFKKISLQFIHVFSDFDGSFPNHGPNPLKPENTKYLQGKVLSKKADLGIAFDGDGDRIVFIDERGDRIEPDVITAFLVNYLFKKGDKILFTVIASRIVEEEIKKIGARPIRYKVGYTFIKEKMKKDKIIFAAESSGHYYFRDNYFIESPLIVLLKVLEILSKENRPFSELIKPFKRYYLERINFEIGEPEILFRKVEKEYKKSVKVSKLDGLTIKFDDWWFNIRPSNTEPILRLTIEAKTKEVLEEKKKELIKLIPSCF